MIEDLGQLIGEAEKATLTEHRFPNVQLKASWRQEHGHQLSGRANDLKYPSCWMVIGLNDDGSSCRKDEAWAKQQEEGVSNHINLYLDPAQACTYLRCHPLSSGWIIVIGVSNPGAVVRWANKAYKSAGTTCLEMTPEAALELTISLPGLQDYSARPWTGPVDTLAVLDFAKRIASQNPAGDLRLLPTMTAEMILQRLHLHGKAASRMLFGDVNCRLVVYDIADAVLQNTRVSPLYRLLTPDFQRSLSAILRPSPSPSPCWPNLALSEGLANAVAHAAYFEHSGDLIIELHPKWLCISNLCIRTAAAFANKWFSRRHQSLNTLLMESLRLARFVDELGRGKHLILREYLLAGRQPPQVTVEPAGRLSRWRLFLPTDSTDERIIRLLTRLKEYYEGDEKIALLALALCLWHAKPFSEIRKSVDADSEPLLLEILDDLQSPVFLLEQEDRLSTKRWVRLILEQGLDSKQLSPGEEDRLLQFARHMQTQYNAGVITPKRLRELGQMGESNSERTLSSTILKRWETAGHVAKTGTGKYRFVVQVAPQSAPSTAESTVQAQ